MTPEALFRQPFFAHDGKTRLPQYVAHRGFNKIYPENTLNAFQAAIDVGCHGIETDVQISRDGIIVISHDATLNRCYGIDKTINQCDWEYLRTLQTIREPRQGMIRLSDLLEFLSSEGRDHVWVLLDIKRNNPAEVILPKLAEMLSPGPYSSQRWDLRIMLGCWTASYFPLCKKFLPEFQPTLIGYNVLTARRVLRTEAEVSFNTHFRSVKGPLGYGFVNAVHRASNNNTTTTTTTASSSSSSKSPRLVLGWTINSFRDIRWAIRHGFDAILTDDPAVYKLISDSWTEAYSRQHEQDDNKVTMREAMFLTFWSVWIVVFGWVLPYIYPYMQRFMVEKPAVKSRIQGSSERT